MDKHCFWETIFTPILVQLSYGLNISCLKSLFIGNRYTLNYLHSLIHEKIRDSDWWVIYFPCHYAINIVIDFVFYNGLLLIKDSW